jgi:hypothetical protein
MPVPRVMALASGMRMFAAVIAALMLPAALAAQATVTVPVQDPVYRDLDRLFGSGLIKTMIVGQRPYSRRDIARIVLDASQSPPRRSMSAGNRRILARLARQFAPEIEALRDAKAPLERVVVHDARLEAVGTNSPPRAIPSDGSGGIDADVNPLLAGRAGRIYRVGTNVAADADVALRAARSLVVRIDPRVVANVNGSGTLTQGSIEAASVTWLVRNIAIEAGRQQFVWGQGMEGGLLGSSSGRPLDMVRIATDTPFFLYKIGPTRGSLVVGQLGANQRFPHSTFVAYKLSGNPFVSRFELSASVFAEQGGRGAPGATLVDNLVDLVPALKYTLQSQNRAQFSNKFAGWEYRLRLPELSGLQLYAEHQFDDMDPRRWRSTLWEDGGHLVGFSFAQLGAESNLSTAVEFHHTGIRYYKHGVFTSGIAFNRVLIGDPLGNQADGGYWRLAWDAGGASTVTLDAAVERRGGDDYNAIVDGTPPNETNFRFVKLQARANEFRHRAGVTWLYRAPTRWRGSLEAAYEHAANYAFVGGASRNGFLLSAGVELLPW